MLTDFTGYGERGGFKSKFGVPYSGDGLNDSVIYCNREHWDNSLEKEERQKYFELNAS